MFLTNVLLKKIKSKQVLVVAESVVSGHKLYIPRDRTGDKLEFIRFDPLIRTDSVYKEVKRMKGINYNMKRWRWNFLSPHNPQRGGNLTGTARVLNDLVVTFYNHIQSWKSSIIDGVKALQKVQLSLENPVDMETYSVIVGKSVQAMKEKVLDLENLTVKLDNLALLNEGKPSYCRTWSIKRVAEVAKEICNAHKDETLFREKIVRGIENRSLEDLQIIVVMWLHANIVDHWIDAALESLLMECRLKYSS